MLAENFISRSIRDRTLTEIWAKPTFTFDPVTLKISFVSEVQCVFV